MDRGSDSPRGLGRWVTQHERLVMVLICGLSLAIRASYWVEISSGPGSVQHRWQQTDMSFFHQWATVIADGDLLTDRALHPLHGWHRQLAEIYFARHATAAERRVAGADPEQRARWIWNRWGGGKRFHQAPLYPYLLALSHALGAVDPRWFFIFQLLIGTLTNLLVYLVTRRYFGPAAAVVAGGMAVLCGPLLFYEAVLLRTSLLAFAGLGLVQLAGWAGQEQRWPRYVALGVAGGLATLLKPTMLGLALGLAILLLWRHRKSAGIAWRAAWIAGGMTLALSPAVARNVAVGVSPFSLASQGAITVIIFSAEGAQRDGSFNVPYEHGPRIMAAHGGRLLPTAVAAVKTHDGWGFLALLAGKLAHTWHWAELPNNASFYFYRAQAPTLRWLPVTQAIVAPLALIGLLIALGRVGERSELYLLVGMQLAVILLTGPLSRYRVPLLAAHLPFAGFAAWYLAAGLRQRTPSWRLAAGGAALIAALLLPATYDRLPLIRPADRSVARRLHFAPLRRQATASGDWQRVADLWQQELAAEPDWTARAVERQPAHHKWLAQFYASAYLGQAKALTQLDRKSEASRATARARELLSSAPGR